ncbi:MAG: hypothetical protein ACRDIE_07800, partial [Chloroflexota bacterium]
MSGSYLKGYGCRAQALRTPNPSGTVDDACSGSSGRRPRLVTQSKSDAGTILVIDTPRRGRYL